MNTTDESGVYTPVEEVPGEETAVICESTEHDEFVLVIERDETRKKYYGGVGYSLPLNLVKDCSASGVTSIVIVEYPSETEIEFTVEEYIYGTRFSSNTPGSKSRLFVPRSTGEVKC